MKDYHVLKINLKVFTYEVDNKNEEAVAYYKEQGFKILRSYQPEMYGEKLDLALMYKVF